MEHLERFYSPSSPLPLVSLPPLKSPLSLFPSPLGFHPAPWPAALTSWRNSVPASKQGIYFRHEKNRPWTCSWTTQGPLVPDERLRSSGRCRKTRVRSLRWDKDALRGPAETENESGVVGQAAPKRLSPVRDLLQVKNRG